MPVHFKVAAHEANSMPSFNLQVTNADQLLAATWGKQTRTLRSAGLLQTSYHSGKQDFSKIKPLRNGFVDTVTEAYNQHYHLVIKLVISLELKEWFVERVAGRMTFGRQF
jgi:hypothetical protein